jgi:hypothetical protein
LSITLINSLNAISLVNLVISLGIAVEFCSHIARGYVNAGGSAELISDGDGPGGQKDRDERVFSVLVDVAPSVSTLPLVFNACGVLTVQVGFVGHHVHQAYRHCGSCMDSISFARGE